MLALRKQISQIKAAEELGLSLSHTKLLMRKLKKAEIERELAKIRSPVLPMWSASTLYRRMIKNRL